MTAGLVILRFSVTLVLAFGFGFLRQRLGKPIGFGTFIFVAAGACALALTAVEFNSENPLPLLGAIVTGIGFLGAGALFRTADRVVGFTSAATIWVFAVFGLTMGVGEYLVAGLVYVGIFAVVLTDWRMERKWIGAHQKKLSIEVPIDTTDQVLASEFELPPRRSAVSVRIDREDKTLLLIYSIKRPASEEGDLLQRLSQNPLVRRATLD